MPTSSSRRRSPHSYGRLAESIAAWRLRLAGYRIVGRNVRVAGREVDVLARRGSLLVVCEVKARRSGAFGSPLEAVGADKQQRLRRAGEILVARDPTVQTVRFDVIAIDGFSVRHLRAAF
jgi:putative endonuclease